MRKFIVTLIAVTFISVTPNAKATDYSLTGEVTAAFDLGFSPIALPDINIFPGFAAVYQIDYSMTTTNVSAGELGFANVGFNIAGNNLSDSFGIGWTATTEQVDTNGGIPGGVAPLFATNIDAGTPLDLQGILVSIAGGLTTSIPTDDRILVGQAPNGNRFMGTIYMEWDGVTPGDVSTNGVLASSNSVNGEFLPSSSSPSDTILFGVPEPSTLVLAGLALVGTFCRRKF
jgi:hypothetical protein